MPPKVDDLAVMRIRVREGFSRDLADMLLADFKSAVDHFESQPGYKSPHEGKRGKVHKHLLVGAAGPKADKTAEAIQPGS